MNDDKTLVDQDGAEIAPEATATAADAGQAAPEDNQAGDEAETANEKTNERGALPPEVQAAIDKRIGKITAKQKAAEEEAQQLRDELKALRQKAEEADAAKIAHLGVPPQFFSAEEKTAVQEAEAAQSKAELNAEYFAELAEKGEDADVGGRTFTAAQCRRFSLEWAKRAGSAEGRKESIVERARAAMVEKLKKLESPGASRPAVKAAPAKPAASAASSEPPPPNGAQVVMDAGKRIVLKPGPKNAAEARRMMEYD